LPKLLSRTDAVFIGLAAMLGAGVFVVFGPAYALSGPWILLAILLAALVSYLNAMSISQLAAVVTRSGGTYAYGRHYLGESWGFLAGAAFLVGKVGSAAAIALTFANYVFPTNPVPVAIAALFVMTGINLAGVNRTALGSKVLATITLLFLLFTVAFAFFLPSAPVVNQGSFDALGVFTAASLFFFAFAGYARVATLGAEVKDSGNNVPAAIRISLGVVFAVYLLLGYLLPAKLGSQLALSLTPIADLYEAFGQWGGVWIFASVAALGSVLALMAGMGRTAATMAEDGELPKSWARKLGNGAPWVSELSIAVLVAILIVSGDQLTAIGLSSFAILLYYAVANFAAFKQPASETNRSKSMNILGLVLCLAIGLSVPVTGLALGVLVLTGVMLLRWGLAKLQ